MKLFYRHYGKGDPVIILHGIFGISDNWVTIGRRIAEKFSVYIPDQRNHGQSTHSPTFNYYALTSDLEEFIYDQGFEKVVLIGHSMGGKVAMNYAMEHPSMVEKLVVIDIGPRKYTPRKTHINMISAMLSVDFDVMKTRAGVEDILAGTIPQERIRMFIMKNLYRVNKERLGWRINIEAISHNIHDMFSGFEHTGIFHGPAMFVRGGASDYILDEDIPEIRSFFPEFTLKTIPGASHWVHADEPDHLCSLLSEFLEKECIYNPEN